MTLYYPRMPPVNVHILTLGFYPLTRDLWDNIILTNRTHWAERRLKKENMTTVISTKEFGSRLGLGHKEVIRRIRRGDIKADKFGWVYTIDEKEVARVQDSDWYKRYQSRHAVTS